MDSTDSVYQDIAKRRAVILARIQDAARAPLAAPEPHLVAISKKQPDMRIDAALQLGQRIFGENRVQDAQNRWTGRKATYPDLQLRLVGPLQTNKAEDAVSFFDVIETLDRPKLARALAKAAQKTGHRPEIFIQVNTGEEPQKAGVLPEELSDLIDFARSLGLDLQGLMCIPPVDEPAGPHFALLAKLAHRHGLEKLSMGMSADYELAIQYGASHVRVGSGFFGARA